MISGERAKRSSLFTESAKVTNPLLINLGAACNKSGKVEWVGGVLCASTAWGFCYFYRGKRCPTR